MLQSTAIIVRKAKLALLVMAMTLLAFPALAQTRTRTDHYQNGGTRSYGFLGNIGRGNTGVTMYPGSSTPINRPHRASWYAMLKAQRKWDEMQYAQAQLDGKSVACGLSNAPAYCYRLMGPYPSELRIVRY